MGFQAAAKIALERGAITQDQMQALHVKFLIKEAETMGRERELDLAKDCYRQAIDINRDTTVNTVKALGFSNREWVSQ